MRRRVGVRRVAARPFVVRPAYEYTHASNNYYAARRYINLIDDRAVGCFLAKTHDAYWKWLGPYFGSTVQATFTDEPSLIAINLGRKKRCGRSIPIDPTVRPLPVVPWCYDLPERFQEHFSRDLLPLRRSLFAGQRAGRPRSSAAVLGAGGRSGGRAVLRRDQAWCAAHHIASSGHSLWEEAPAAPCGV